MNFDFDFDIGIRMGLGHGENFLNTFDNMTHPIRYLYTEPKKLGMLMICYILYYT